MTRRKREKEKNRMAVITLSSCLSSFSCPVLSFRLICRSFCVLSCRLCVCVRVFVLLVTRKPKALIDFSRGLTKRRDASAPRYKPKEREKKKNAAQFVKPTARKQQQRQQELLQRVKRQENETEKETTTGTLRHKRSPLR